MFEVYAVAIAFFILVVYLAARDARKRRAARPPVTIRRSRSEPLFGWDFTGPSYAVERSRVRSLYEGYSNSSFETIAIAAPPMPVRFLVDQANVYRGMSDLFATARVDTTPDLAQCWRSDEPERLKWLVKDERFGKWLYELRTIPDFAALAVADANDQRLPVGTVLGKVSSDGDVIALTRMGEEVPYRDERDVNEDVARLTKLRDLLLSIQIPETLERGAASGLVRTSFARLMRMLILFVAIIAFFWLLGTILWHC